MGEPTALADVSFREVIHRLRYWLAMHNVPGAADKIKVEVHFPDHQSQHYAAMELLRELSTEVLMSQLRDNFHRGPVEPDRLEIEGITVVFTNPDRWDKRRP